MDLENILKDLGGLAKRLAPSIVPGAGALIEAAEALNRAYDTVKGLNGGQAPADAEAAHDALVEKVSAHAEGTLGRAERGDG